MSTKTIINKLISEFISKPAVVALTLVAVFLWLTAAPSTSATSTSTSGSIEHTYVSITSNGSINLNINPNNTLQEVVDNISISSNTNAGYRVYVSMNSKEANANRLYLDGNTTDDTSRFIAPLTTTVSSSNFPTNFWGLSTDTTANKTYTGMPLKGQELLLKEYAPTNNPITEPIISTLPIYYAAKVDNSLVAGNYTGTIVYTALANDSTITQITPTTSLPTGGTTLTIDTPLLMLDDITPTANVTIGGTTCTNPEVKKDNNTGHFQVECTLPAKDPGEYDVTVTYSNLQNGEERTYTASSKLTYTVPYHITTTTPNLLSATGTITTTITTDIPASSTLNVEPANLRFTNTTNPSDAFTCASATIGTAGGYKTITCSHTGTRAIGTYNLSTTMLIDGFTMPLNLDNAITTNPAVSTIPWLYPTTILTTGTRDKLVIATGNSTIANEDQVTVEVDGQVCADPQIVNGGATDSTYKVFFKFITCTPPAMPAGLHYVSATVSHDSTDYLFNDKAITYKTPDPAFTNRLTNIPELKMQNINQLDTDGPDSTKTFCANSTTPKFGDAIELVPEVKLVDARDNQEYTVRKLADGNCWMTENLRYGSTPNNEKRPFQAGDAALSDNVDAEKMANLIEARICESDTGCKTADGSYDAFTANGDNYTMPYAATYQANTVNEFDTSFNVTKYGVFYNYCAATGGTVCTDAGMTADAPGSICPANWKLPAMTAHPSSTDSTATAIKDGTVKTFNNLFNNYNINYRNVFDFEETKLMTNSLDFIRAGTFENGILSARNTSGSGIYWASTRYSGANSAYYPLFYSNFVGRSGNYRYRGRSVRCVAR